MANEIELKLRFDPQHIAALVQKLDSLAARQGASMLNNQYYDTADAALSRAGCALRIRQEGDSWEQTLKTKGHSTGGLQQRGEWNWPLRNPVLDASRFTQRDVIAHWPSQVQIDQLQPLFTTHFHRHRWRWQHNDQRVELVVDDGHVATTNDTQPLCELELELLAGTPECLWQLATQLGEHTPLWLSDISKAERGYRLAIPGTHWTPDSLPSDPLLPWINRHTTLIKRELEALIWDQHTDVTRINQLIVDLNAMQPQALSLDTWPRHWSRMPPLSSTTTGSTVTVDEVSSDSTARNLLALAHWVWMCHQ